jgi:hypothetical protein
MARSGGEPYYLVGTKITATFLLARYTIGYNSVIKSEPYSRSGEEHVRGIFAKVRQIITRVGMQARAKYIGPRRAEGRTYGLPQRTIHATGPEIFTM